MIDTVIATILIVALLFGLPLCLLVFRDRISIALWNRRNPPEKLAADRRAHEERIVHPDWEFYERHLQRPVPLALRTLYADRPLVTAQGVDFIDDDGFEETISSFEPLDQQGLLETRRWLGFDAVAIATSDAGDPIYLRPGQSERDIVYITFHDGGDTETLAESVETLLKRLKVANGDE